MKVATWNVNSIRTRKEIVGQWLQQEAVDVLCLQETKVIDRDFPREPFEKLGYHLYISGQKAYNGVAIFSKIPLEDVKMGFTPILGEEATGDFDQQKRLIMGSVAGVRLINVYVPNGAEVNSEKYQYKLKWLKLLKVYIQRLLEESLPVCLCGDFNIAPDDRDIYNPTGKKDHIMATPAERNTLEELLSLGLKDGFRKFNTEEGHYTWWDYRRGGFTQNRGWRIDHQYVTEQLYQKTHHSWIDIEPRRWEKPSDHTPVIIEF